MVLLELIVHCFRPAGIYFMFAGYTAEIPKTNPCLLSSVCSRSVLERSNGRLRAVATVKANPVSHPMENGTRNPMQVLLDAGADVDAQDTESCTALMIAVLISRYNIVDILLNKGASVHLTNNRHHSALTIAVMQEQTRSVESLLRHEASIHVGFPIWGSAIFLCSLLGNLKLIGTILSITRNSVDYKDNTGRSALERAVTWGKLRAVEILLECGASANHSDPFGNTVLLRSVSSKAVHREEIVSTLIEHNASVAQSNHDKITPVHAAAKNGDSHVAEILLSAGTSPAEFIDAVDGEGNTPLHCAVVAESMETTKLLVRFGANVHVKDRNGCTPLHVASGSKAVGIVVFLLHVGARVDARNNVGESALSVAADSGHTDVARLLLSKGASVAIPQPRRGFVNELSLAHGPLHIAAYRGDIDLATLLLDHFSSHGVNVDALDGHSLHSPLGIAAQYGDRNLPMIKLLLSRGASPGTGEWRNDARSVYRRRALEGQGEGKGAVTEASCQPRSSSPIV